MHNFPKYGTYYLYANSLHFYALKIKYYSPLQDKCCMFYILTGQFECLSMSLASLFFGDLILHGHHFCFYGDT